MMLARLDLWMSELPKVKCIFMRKINMLQHNRELRQVYLCSNNEIISNETNFAN